MVKLSSASTTIMSVVNEMGSAIKLPRYLVLYPTLSLSDAPG